MLVVIPAQSFEQVVVCLGSKLDATQETHWRLRVQILREFDLIQIFRRYPTEYGPDAKKYSKLKHHLQ